jgi:hypothetical protein
MIYAVSCACTIINQIYQVSITTVEIITGFIGRLPLGDGLCIDRCPTIAYRNAIHINKRIAARHVWIMLCVCVANMPSQIAGFIITVSVCIHAENNVRSKWGAVCS